MTWPPDQPEADYIEFRCLECGSKWSAYGRAIPDTEPDGSFGGWDIYVDEGADECPTCPAGESDVDIEGVSYA